ncbi:MAG: pilus assembly protein TadG-related protein [Pseudomonadota bacterium]|uniref:pilus assembly protein TadG-related protein n=1 Tax=unclassified Phenylobacterium TaxID=2640670 RepID=UPI0006FEF654|nr:MULTISPECIES: pilus assembly protein TadG-related protein [unclassified Phenylobacterium]KRB52650.1 hypothetical protein ASE02_11750 [Phenylobacterium sp. Root700]MBT9472730.1 hypothetical protein [Phenylobacterium sp.]
MLRAVGKFLHAERGAVAPLFAVGLTALIGMGALAWDVSRAYALRAELDAAVDAAALAGAGQLDGGAGAMTRATSAAQGALVQNAQRLANAGESNVSIASADITFLVDLTTRAAAGNDADAHFIQINLTPRNLGLVTGALVSTISFNVTAHAVAGYGSALCLVPPLMICNPNGSGSFDGDSYTGRALILTSPPGQSMAPGNFGFLQVGNGATAVKDAMGRNPPLTECFGSMVTTEPGNIQSADDWFNTRFDIYRASASGNKTDPAFAPALNTMTGVKSNAGASSCTPSTTAPPDDCSNVAAAPNGYGFPKDCSQGSAYIGSGQWNVQKYFATNHSGLNPGTYVPSPPGSPGFPGNGWDAYGPPPVAGATSPTRYQVYNWELAMLSGAISKPPGAFSDSQDDNPPSGNYDHARPSCNTTNPTQASPDRRTISAVVVDCGPIHGRSTVAVISRVDFFLTAPADSATIYGEFISATSSSSAVGQTTQRNWVRLYE